MRKVEEWGRPAHNMVSFCTCEKKLNDYCPECGFKKKCDFSKISFKLKYCIEFGNSNINFIQLILKEKNHFKNVSLYGRLINTQRRFYSEIKYPNDCAILLKNI